MQDERQDGAGAGFLEEMCGDRDSPSAVGGVVEKKDWRRSEGLVGEGSRVDVEQAPDVRQLEGAVRLICLPAGFGVSRERGVDRQRTEATNLPADGIEKNSVSS